MLLQSNTQTQNDLSCCIVSILSLWRSICYGGVCHIRTTDNSAKKAHYLMLVVSLLFQKDTGGVACPAGHSCVEHEQKLQREG